MDNEKIMACFCHISGFFFGFIGPLIIWLLGKDNSELVDKNGKEALNFQLSFILYIIISSILCLVIIGIFGFIILFPLYYILIIIATIQVAQGHEYKYPFTIRFIK